MEKWLLLAAMIIAGLLLLLYGLDLALPKAYAPFSKAGLTQDILFLVGCGLVLWQGWETWREMT